MNLNFFKNRTTLTGNKNILRPVKNNSPMHVMYQGIINKAVEVVEGKIVIKREKIRTFHVPGI